MAYDASVVRSVDKGVTRFLRDYPRVFFACHARRVHDALSRRVLTRHQASILEHLDGDDPRSLRRLATSMGVTPATMSLHVERLVRKGFVRRRRDPADRRIALLTLTAAGTRIRERRALLDRRRVAAILSRLGAREREEALRGLGHLARAAAEVGAPGDGDSGDRARG